MIKDLSKLYEIFRPLNEFETWLKDIDKQEKILSKLYNQLLSLSYIKDTAKSSFRKYWEQKLHIEITDEQWKVLCYSNYKFTINIAFRENRFKLLYKWYLIPACLATIYPHTTFCYWKCEFLRPLIGICGGNVIRYGDFG